MVHCCAERDFLGGPWKINMEPTNHPFRKEHDLPNLHEKNVPCQFSGVYVIKSFFEHISR